METNSGMEAIKNACARGLRLELTHGHKSEIDYGPMVIQEYENSKKAIIDALVVAAGYVVVAENRRLWALCDRLAEDAEAALKVNAELTEKGGIGE